MRRTPPSVISTAAGSQASFWLQLFPWVAHLLEGWERPATAVCWCHECQSDRIQRKVRGRHERVQVRTI